MYRNIPHFLNKKKERNIPHFEIIISNIIIGFYV